MINGRVRYTFGALALVCALAGCGAKESGQPASSSAAAPAAGGSVSDQVTSVFERFFDGTQPVDTKIGLLQKGEGFRQVLQAQAAGPLAKSSGVKVVKVAQSTQNSAAVTFTVLLDGKPALENQVGGAVLDNGAWKISANTYCSLLKLQGLNAPPCAGAGS
jgi:hypothetical protein